MSTDAALAAGAMHDDLLAAVRCHVNSNFKISHVTVQVKSEGCASSETHL